MNENEKIKDSELVQVSDGNRWKHMNWVNTCIPNSRKNLIIRKKSL